MIHTKYQLALENANFVANDLKDQLNFNVLWYYYTYVLRTK